MRVPLFRVFNGSVTTKIQTTGLLPFQVPGDVYSVVWHLDSFFSYGLIEDVNFKRMAWMV